MPIGRGPNWRSWGQEYKNRSCRKTDAPKTYSPTENQFSGKTYFHSLASSMTFSSKVLMKRRKFPLLIMEDCAIGLNITVNIAVNNTAIFAGDAILTVLVRGGTIPEESRFTTPVLGESYH